MKKIPYNDNTSLSNKLLVNEEKKLISVRKKINCLYFKQKMSKKSISNQEGVSKNFVIKWTKSPDQDWTDDQRGWPKGVRRKWNQNTEKFIKDIHCFLTNDPRSFFTGATAIDQEWRRRYPAVSPPPLRTIGQIMRDLGLSEKRRKDRGKGATKYLCYPEYTVYHLLGGRLLEADFIGHKFITGLAEPLNFIGFSFKLEPRLRYYQRVNGQTASCFMSKAEDFFQRFETPNYVKVDNCLATIGSASGKRNISQTMNLLLKKQIIPIFSVPRKPFSQASIEGNNSVFAKRFWNKTNFQSPTEIDEKLEWFNQSSLAYTNYQSFQTKQLEKKDFIPKVYFIRQVKEKNQVPAIDVLNEVIPLKPAYLNYFVLAEWNLSEEKLNIYLEKEQKSELFQQIDFPINSKSSIYS